MLLITLLLRRKSADPYQIEHIIHLRNEFNFWNVHGIINIWVSCKEFGCGLNRFVHEGMKHISNVKVHLKTCSGSVNIYIHEPQHEISNNVVCGTSKGSDQPVHMQSLITAFASRLKILWVLSY